MVRPFHQVDPEDDVHAGLEPGAGDFAVALPRVPVTEVEVGAVVKDRKVDRGALAHLLGIHVAAEVSRPEPREGFLPTRGHRDPAEHRLEVDLHPLHPALRHLRHPDHARGVQAPDIATGGDRLVEHPHP
jgi:hypothetical protein